MVRKDLDYAHQVEQFWLLFNPAKSLLYSSQDSVPKRIVSALAFMVVWRSAIGLALPSFFACSRILSISDPPFSRSFRFYFSNFFRKSSAFFAISESLGFILKNPSST